MQVFFVVVVAAIAQANKNNAIAPLHSISES